MVRFFMDQTLIRNLIYWKVRDPTGRKARTVVDHASDYLNDLSLKTRIMLTTTFKTLNSDYLCDDSGLFSFIRKEVIKTTYFQDCGTMMSNNGGAHMLLTNQESGFFGIARAKSICNCTNGWVMDSMAIPVVEFSREELAKDQLYSNEITRFWELE